MEIIPGKKLGGEMQEAERLAPVELAEVMDKEKAAIGIEVSEKKDEKPGWRQKAGAILLGITILASAMAGMTKEANAREGFNFSRRAAESLQQGLNQGISEAFQADREQRQRMQNRQDQVFNAQLDMERQMIQQQINDRNQIRQMNVDQVRQEIQQINNRINTYEQVKTEAIRKLNDPKADKAGIQSQIRICESEIAKLEQKRAAYLGAATGISQTPPPAPQMRPNPGYAPPPAPQGQWRPLPPQTPPPPPQIRPQTGRPLPPPVSPNYNKPVSPPSYSNEAPLPPLPDL